MEPRWDVPPPTPTNLPYLPLVRVPPGKPLSGLLTSQSVLGVWTHFLGGRTLPCMSSDCKGCEAQMPKRWEGYISLITPSPSKHILVALTPGAALGISDTAPDPLQLRGNLVIFERGGKRLNSRLRARVERVDFYQKMLPPEPNLKEHLVHIWGLDQSQLGQDNPQYVNRVAEHYRRNGQTTDASSVE